MATLGGSRQRNRDLPTGPSRSGTKVHSHSRTRSTALGTLSGGAAQGRATIKGPYFKGT